MWDLVTTDKVVDNQVNTRICWVYAAFIHSWPAVWCYRKPWLPKRGYGGPFASSPINQKILLWDKCCETFPKWVYSILRNTAGGVGFLFDLWYLGNILYIMNTFIIIQMYRFSTVSSVMACPYCVCTLVFRKSIFIQGRTAQCFWPVLNFKCILIYHEEWGLKA